MIIDDILAEAVGKLKHAATDNRHVEAAQMRLVNLDVVIRAAGVNWQDAREKIRVGSMSFLRGCLAEEDIVIPCGDGFLIIFASTDAEEVTRLVEEVERLLIQFYLGQEGLDQLQVQTARQTLPAFAPRQFSSAADASLLRAHIRAWATRLAQGRMNFFLDDLCGEASARRAVELGANFLSSLALWPCAQQPGEVRHAVLA